MLDENDLEVLGLNKNLTRLYMAILHSNGLSAAQLASAVGITRSNIYALVDQLVAANLVNVDFEGSKRRYTPRDPAILRQNVEDRLKVVERLMPELQALYGASSVKPKISYFEGELAAKTVFEDLLTVRDDHYCYFGSLAAQLAVEGPENARKLVQRRLKKGIRTRSIRTKAADLEEPIFMAGEEYLREVRYYPKPMPDNIPDIYIYDNRLAILASYREHYALIIESHELAGLMRGLWDIIWDVSLVSAPALAKAPKSNPPGKEKP